MPKRNPAPVIEPILYTPPTVTIAGVEYPLRRLNTYDVFKVVPIVSKGASAILAGNGSLSNAQMLQVLFSALLSSEKEVIELLASIIGVAPQDFRDGERFPMTTMVDIIEALAEHEDLKAFTERVQTVLRRLPGLSNPTTTA
jgi:hypothetical protein